MNGVRATKQRIVSIAAELFAKHGYHGTSISQLSTATGLGRSTLYYHIKSKESLLSEVSQHHLRDMVSFARTVVKLTSPPDEKIRIIARAHLKDIADHLPEWTVFFRERDALESRSRDQILKLRDEYEGIWDDLYGQGVEEGIFRDLDRVTVKGLLGILNYSYLWIRPDGRLSPEEIADVFTDVLLYGILSGDKLGLPLDRPEEVKTRRLNSSLGSGHQKQESPI